MPKVYENFGKLCEKMGLYEESVKAYEIMLKYEVALDTSSELNEDIISTNNIDNSLLMYRNE
jgi:hypothetical protein